MRSACLIQHVVDARPMHGEQKSVRVLRSLTRRPRPRMPFGILGKPLQLLRAACIAEHHLMPRAREEGPEFAAHQPRTEDANAHAAPPSAMPDAVSGPRVPPWPLPNRFVSVGTATATTKLAAV